MFMRIWTNQLIPALIEHVLYIRRGSGTNQLPVHVKPVSVEMVQELIKSTCSDGKRSKRSGSGTN